MGAGAGASQKDRLDDQIVINSAGGTPCRSPQSTSDKEGIFRWPSNKTASEENDLLFQALKEEMEMKARIAEELARIRAGGGGSNAS